MAVTTWGTWWTLLWLWLYGVLFAASNPIWHECGHKTAFKSKIYNDIFYQIGSFMTDFEPTRWTWSHFRHHSNTASIKDPHDYEAALFHGYPSLSNFLFSFVPFAELIRFKHAWKFETIKHALGFTTPVMKDCIPENDIRDDASGYRCKREKYSDQFSTIDEFSDLKVLVKNTFPDINNSKPRSSSLISVANVY